MGLAWLFMVLSLPRQSPWFNATGGQALPTVSEIGASSGACAACGHSDRRALLQRTRRSPLRPSRSEESARANASGRAGRETTGMSARENMQG